MDFKTPVFGWGSIALVFMASGCAPIYKDVVKQRTQAIEVTSSPSGALITLQDENGSRNVGQTPTRFEEKYEVVERTYDGGSCALAGAGAVADAMSDHDGHSSPGEGIAMLLGLFVGAAVGAASCAEANGAVSVDPKPLVVGATLPGYHPQQVPIEVPKKKPRMHFELVPIDAPPPQVAQPPRPTLEIQANRLVVFGIQDTTGELDRWLVQQLSKTLFSLMKSSDTLEVIDLTESTADPQNLDKQPLDADLQAKIALDLSAQYFLDTKILKTDVVCFVSANLADTLSKKVKTLAATRTTCDDAGLFSAIEKVANILANPPEKPHLSNEPLPSGLSERNARDR